MYFVYSVDKLSLQVSSLNAESNIMHDEFEMVLILQDWELTSGGSSISKRGRQPLRGLPKYYLANKTQSNQSMK